jgi:DNA-binding PadR family transcriptional regulator
MTPRPANTVTPQALEIMLSLAEGELHGYALIQHIEERTGGAVRLTASTLYGAIKRMLDAGWIRERAGSAEDVRRRTYVLSAAGQRVLRQELRRIAGWAAEAQRLKLLEESGQ